MARRTTISLPSVTLPSVPVPRSPTGWGRSEFSLRKTPLPIVNQFKDREPAGDIPPEMQARYPTMTKPEWAVWWGLERNGLVEGLDFVYSYALAGAEISYYSTVDFLLGPSKTALEVQGQYWHYASSARQRQDMMRYLYFSQQGMTLIFIDEEDAIARPIVIVREALAGRDHSKLARKV